MTLHIRNSRIKLSQGQLFWREVGQGAAIVFLHGTWHDSDQWLPVIEQLRGDYHCIAPDLLGFGESEHPNIHYSIELEVECLAEYLEALKLREVYLVGDSLGGWIAASYALRYPHQLAGLVLLAPEGVEAPGLKHRWQGARLLLLPVTGWVLRSLHTLNKLLKLPGVVRLLQRRRHLLQLPVACQLLFRRRWAEVKAEFLNDRLGWLKVPALILQGERDTSAAATLSQTYAQLIPQMELEQISEVGDGLLQEQPDAVAQAIREFVSRGRG